MLQSPPSAAAVGATPGVLMSGCEAIAQGAWEGGAHALVSYPGSPVTSVVEALRARKEITSRWAANEKVALEMAAGAAYGGANAVAVMKHVGVNVAADPLFNLAYTGVRGALVIVVGDDPGATCSQNEQDTRMLAAAANIPVLEPSDVAEALLFTKLAFALSREFDLPVIVRVTTQLCYATQTVVPSIREAQAIDGGFAKPVQKYLLLPGHVPARHRSLIASLERLRASAWSAFFVQEHWPSAPRGGDVGKRHPVGLICAGATAAQCLEHFEGRVPMLQVGCAIPLNVEAIDRFARQCEQLVVSEEGSTYLADQVRARGHRVADLGAESSVGVFRVERLRDAGVPALDILLDKLLPKRVLQPLKVVGAVPTPLSFKVPVAPPRPPGFCAGCSHVGAFDFLRRLGRYVVGDIGCYTLGATPAFGALDSNLCMGASVGVLQGYLMVAPERRHDAIAVIGDSTFFHSGIPSVITAVGNGHRGTLLILDNSGTAMTGFQRTSPNLDAEGWDRLLHGLGVVHRAVVPALDAQAIERQVLAFDEVDSFAVVVLKGQCVQARPRPGPTNFRYTVTTSACTGCGACRERTDCPALVPTKDANGRTVFEISKACVGCGMCSQTCPERAILPRTVRTGVPILDRALGHVRWDRAVRFVQGNERLHRIASRFERELD